VNGSKSGTNNATQAVTADIQQHRIGASAFNRAMAVPFVFGLAFAATYPPIESEPPYHHHSLVPTIVVFALGILGWCFVLWSIVRGLRAGVDGGSGWAAVSLVPLAAYSFGLHLAYIAIR
jgi:hypothetical protein